MQSDTDERKASKASRPLPYAPPQLMRYGAVRDLTSGGSIGVAEGTMMTDMMKHV